MFNSRAQQFNKKFVQFIGELYSLIMELSNSIRLLYNSIRELYNSLRQLYNSKDVQLETSKFIIKKTLKLNRGHHGCDRMIVGFMTTYAISAYHH